MFLSLLTVTVIGVGAYGLTILNQTTGALSKTYKSFGNETNVIAENKPMTILLMGLIQVAVLGKILGPEIVIL